MLELYQPTRWCKWRWSMASRIIALLYFIQASEVMYICFDISWAGCLVLNFVMVWDMARSEQLRSLDT